MIELDPIDSILSLIKAFIHDILICGFVAASEDLKRGFMIIRKVFE
jgi:hypothetical protein